ncbi:hypothetical protein MJD09_14730 [bacterium]|nr:hypothetical protein [bacterium]
MSTLTRFSEAWLNLYSIHLIQVSLFIVLVWLIDKFFPLNTRLCYILWVLALVKILVPPVMTFPSGIENILQEPAMLLPFVAIEVGTSSVSNPVSHAVVLFCLWLLYAAILIIWIISQTWSPIDEFELGAM